MNTRCEGDKQPARDQLVASKIELVSSKIEMLPDPMKWTDTYVETPMPTLCVIEPAKEKNTTYQWIEEPIVKLYQSESVGRRKMSNVEADLHEKQVQAKRRLSAYVKGGVHRRKMQEQIVTTGRQVGKVDTIQ